MGLFDNIFLDQDSPTAMLDPLLTDAQKKQKDVPKVEEKSSEVIPEMPVEVTASTTETISFDDVATEKSETPENAFLTGDASKTDDISFDIGGFDLPAFGSSDTTYSDASDDASGVSFLSGGTPIERGDTPSDTSIALVQGATAATSDSIMETDSLITQDKPMTLIDTSISMIDTPETLVETDTVPAMDVSSDSSNSSLMDMFDDTPEVASTELTLPEVAVVAEPEVTPEPVISLSEETDSVGDILATVADDMTDTEMSFSPPMIASSYSSSDSPLEDMLREFVDRLKKFNDESEAMNANLYDSENTLKAEQDALDEEYATRKKAIAYKRKHREEENEKRKKERARLEGIIQNLEAEIKA